MRLDTVEGTSAVLVVTAGDAGIAAGGQLYIDVYDIRTDDVEEDHLAYLSRQGDPRVVATPFSIRVFGTLRDAVATDLVSGEDGQTQTLCATVAGTDLYPGEAASFDLSGAEVGAARYGGARLQVVGIDGEAELFVYAGGFAEVAFFAGDEGLAEGEVIRIDVVGVNVDEADETHAADAFRWDSWSTTTALFDIGAGSAFVGAPIVSDLEASWDFNWQHLLARLARPVAEVVTFDLSSAEQGGASYAGAVPYLYGPGEASLDVTQDSAATLTFTAPEGGLQRGARIEVELDGVATDYVEELHVVTVTDETTRDTAEAIFGIYDDGWQEEGPLGIP